MLTSAGFLSRIIGFFYRIFLSQAIGAEGIGIYQLIFPVSAVCFALTCAGIQTAVSKVIAEIRDQHTIHSPKDYLYAGFLLSCSLSVICALVLYTNADWIAVHLIMEKRCTPLLQILACSIPLEAIHSLCNGYFFGCKETKPPAVSQLIEQSVRVLSVYMVYITLYQHQGAMPLQMIVIGTVTGEAAAMLYSVLRVYLHLKSHMKCTPVCSFTTTDSHSQDIAFSLPKATNRLCPCIGRITRLALPLSFSRLILNLLVAAEAVYIPNRLMQFGYSSSDALSTLGALTGMALPVILFPTAIVNSASVILLPMVSESDSHGKQTEIEKTVKRSICTCLALGFFSTIGFLIFGNLIGRVLFQNTLVGDLIMTLAFICPFLYMTTTLTSIMHGLGRTTTSFFFSLTGITLRILFVLYAIPEFGIRGYLYGLLLSQVLSTALCSWNLRRYWQA